MARPRKDIDEQLISDLAHVGCSGDEIATIVGCSRDLLYKRFSTVIKEGHENMKASLRRTQFDVAANQKNPTMLIWLGKQFLGQRDKQEVSGENGGPIMFVREFIEK